MTWSWLISGDTLSESFDHQDIILRIFWKLFATSIKGFCLTCAESGFLGFEMV